MDSDSAAENSTAVLADDSGHYSCASDDAGSSASISKSMSHVREHEQSLFLAMQDLRKSRSEVERLSKSEQWYKQELKSQKHSRLETLERLYTQERKYMQENQRLQQECMQLYAKCATLERQMQTPAAVLTPLDAEAAVHDIDAVDGFEAQQQQTRLTDQQRLIEVLRKQKKLLLADIERVSLEHEDKMLQLQRALAGLELENKHVTGKCKQLLDEKSALEHSLETKNSTLRSLTAEREQLRQVVGELNNTLQTQEHLLALKEQEFMDLKQHYNDKLSKECSVDAVHNYSLLFHEEINAKTSEIAALKNSLHDLQNELSLMSKLEAQNEEQQRQLEQLGFALETQQFEHENLKTKDAIKCQQLEEQATSIGELQEEKKDLAMKLQQSQAQLQFVEQELIRLHKEYADMCAICESTKFRLELLQIEHGKLECESDSHLQEISQLRKKLRNYVDECAQLSDAMAAKEAQLDSQTHQAEMWQQQLATKTQQLTSMQEKQQSQHLAAAEKVNKCQNVEVQTESISAIIAEQLNPLKQRINLLEDHLKSVESQKQHTVSLLQKLLRQQDEKIRNTAATEADWMQLLEALQATQQLEEQRRTQLQLKTDELEELNKLFADQNEELQQLQQFSCAQELQRSTEVEQLKQTFHESLAAQAKEAATVKELERQLAELLSEREKNLQQESAIPKAVSQSPEIESLQMLINVLETETGRKFPSTKSWPVFAKLLRKELRATKLQRRKSEELPALRRELAEARGKHEQALERIKVLEQSLAAERTRFEASDLGKCTANAPSMEPAHEVANLIDDYKKLIQQTANETGRPRNSFVMELIERSQRTQPNMCQLTEGIASCQTDVRQLNELLVQLEQRMRPHRETMPSLMEELQAVAEQF
ncbi:myosin-J heavy chain [Scaptodrosophila lebanonensis]|uniref:Myosin-J heavy chain n=1 Tax=Drosophila lebanonensis TaxID=7225 RepID=A0A6J2UCZ5_DROLE|nr:myosin-J heavy chain [Scaptodrosophila lebanonensis]